MPQQQDKQPPQPPQLLLRPEDLPVVFDDVEPVPQPQSSYGVCQIQYADDFVAAYDLFRAVVQSGEVSARVLQLTELCASLNPANYTVWQHRRFVYRGLLQREQSTSTKAAVNKEKSGSVDDDNDDDNNDSDDAPWTRLLRERVGYELALATRLGGDNPKTYQIWYHRRAVLEHLSEVVVADASGESAAAESSSVPSSASSSNDGNDALQRLLRQVIESELAYLRGVAKVDGKNYHAWSYRQFLLLLLVGQHRQNNGGGSSAASDDDDHVWADELWYASDLIEDDCRNNSAWNHRWFVLVHHQKQYHKAAGTKTGGAATTAATATAAPATTTKDPPPTAMVLLDEPVVIREARYALEVAWIDPYNESPWRFFVALVRYHIGGLRQRFLLPGLDGVDGDNESTIREAIASYEQLAWDVMPGTAGSVLELAAAAAAAEDADEEEEGKDAKDAASPGLSRVVVSPHLLAAVVDLLELALASLPAAEGADSAAASEEASSRAVRLCQCLEEIDPIRQKYWRYRAASLLRRHVPTNDDADDEIGNDGQK